MAWRCLSGTFVRVSDLLRPTGSTFRPHIAAENCTSHLDHTLACVLSVVARGPQRGPRQNSLLTNSNENFATSAFFEIDSIAVLRRRHELIGDSRRSSTSPQTMIECATEPWCCCAGDLRSLIHIHFVGKSTRWRSAPCSSFSRFRRL